MGFLKQWFAPDTEANKLLMPIVKDLDKMVDDLVDSYPARADMQRLRANFARGRVTVGSSTHTTGKRYITVCTRDMDGKLHDRNTLTYVLLHEMAHQGDSSYDPEHGPVFRGIFDFLLREATIAGLYTHVNYMRYPKPYCGMVIRDRR